MKQKRIWKCKNCDARVKALKGVIPKPQKCPSCDKTEFE